MNDFFDDGFGLIYTERWGPRRAAKDALFDAAQVLTGGRARMKAQARAVPRRRILVVGVAVPSRQGDMDRVVAALQASRHEITTSIVPMADAGKFENLTRALEQVEAPLTDFDWIVLTDDDVALPRGFMDDFIGLSELAGLALAQPAHRFRSFSSYQVTERRWGSLAHATKFVEIGPVTALRRDTVETLLPFPPSRWAWGLDVYWAQVAFERGWRIGVVDGTPIQHLRPVGGGYDTSAARQEGVEFLARHGVTFTRRDCLAESRVAIPWRTP